MSDQDNHNVGSLVPAGRRDLAPVGSTNCLVSRGLADLVNHNQPDLLALELSEGKSITSEMQEKEPFSFCNRLHLHCVCCDWSVEDNHLEIACCPKCGNPVNKDRTLNFGDLWIYYRSIRNKFRVGCPQTHSEVEIAELDAPDTIRFLKSHFRGWPFTAEIPEQRRYAVGEHSLHCAYCDWSAENHQLQIEHCPKCNGLVSPDRTLRFGGLTIEYQSGANRFFLKNPYIKRQADVEIDERDVPDTIRFLTRYFRPWA